MENIRSFDCTPSPQVLLRVLLYGQKVIIWFPVRSSSDEVGDECDAEICE